MQVWDRHRDLGRFDWRECALEMARDAPVGKHAKCGRFRLQLRQHELRILEIGNRAAEGLAFAGIVDGPLYRRLANADAADRLRQTLLRQFGHEHLDRKSVVSGKSVSVRVDLGGRRIIKTKTHNLVPSTTRQPIDLKDNQDYKYER